MKQLYLASTSPRRRELLQQISVPFLPLSIAIDESLDSSEKAADYVLRMAEEKAQAGFVLLAEKGATEQGSVAALADRVVLAADTTVVFADHILTKPENLEQHINTMLMLSGSTHQVMTAIAVMDDTRLESRLVITEVEFSQISEQQAINYWHTGEPQDKAGGYAIQGLAAVFVRAMHGSYSNVVGLPLAESSELLAQFSVSSWHNGEL